MTGRVSKHRWFAVIWLICAIAAGWFYFHWHIAKDYVGLTEIVQHSIGARESGIIREMLVSIKDNVREGQILAVLDTSDVDSELQLLRRQLEESLQLEEANRLRFTMEMQRLHLQLDNARSDSSERLAELASKQTELAGLNAEIERLQKAESAGLGHSRDMADLIVKRNALSTFLKTQETDVMRIGRRSAPAGREQTTGLPDDDRNLIDAMMAEAREQTNEILRDIIIAENRKQLRTVVSPCDGNVVDIFAYAGDTVREYMPILSVMEASSDFLNVYIPERSDFSVREGMSVGVFPVRSDIPDTTGRVAFIHPGYTRVPDRLTVRGQALWAHIVRVSLDPGHQLRPGEIVHVRIDSDQRRLSVTGSNAYAKTPGGDLSGVTDGPTINRVRQAAVAEMIVPPALAAMTRFEPSGLAWLEKARKYVVVSDDTGLADMPSEHAPIVFLADRNGRVDAEPIRLIGSETINDVEAVTRVDVDSFLVVSSQNISRKSTRKEDRKMICSMQFREGAFHVDHQIIFLDLLLKSLSLEDLEALGLKKLDADQLPVLNIEGAAFRDGALYIGLKAPVADAGAIIWRLADVETVMTGNLLIPGQLSLYGYVDLGQQGSRQRGISDLAFDAKGRLWALSTVPDVGASEQMGGLHRIDRFGDGRLEADTILEFPGQKPEGLCFNQEGEYMIVFDADQATPSYLCGKADNL